MKEEKGRVGSPGIQAGFGGAATRLAWPFSASEVCNLFPRFLSRMRDEIVRWLTHADKKPTKVKMKALTIKCIGPVLALCVSGLFAPQLVRGQGIAYLSNIDQPVAVNASTGSFSIGFTTGNNSSGYSLDSLTVLFANNNTPVLMSAGLDNFSTTTSFQDGVEVGAAGDYTFTPNSPLALAANTSYALLVYPEDIQADVNLSYTISSDFTSVDNWNIPGLNGSDEPLFTIMATPAPEPSVTVLVCASIFAFIVLRLKRMAFSNSTADKGLRLYAGITHDAI